MLGCTRCRMRWEARTAHTACPMLGCVHREPCIAMQQRDCHTFLRSSETGAWGISPHSIWLHMGLQVSRGGVWAVAATLANLQVSSQHTRPAAIPWQRCDPEGLAEDARPAHGCMRPALALRQSRTAQACMRSPEAMHSAPTIVRS